MLCPGNPYEGHRFAELIEAGEKRRGIRTTHAFFDRSLQGRRSANGAQVIAVDKKACLPGKRRTAQATHAFFDRSL